LTEIRTVKGEVGVLKHVMVHDQIPARCFLIIEHEAERYTRCLMVDDPSFCRHIENILGTYLDCPIKEIGDLDLSHTY
jgi:hypothetical protein